MASETIDNPYAVINRRFNSIEAKVDKLLARLEVATTTPVPSASAPITSAKQLKDMTGWPDGTFYAKVAEMPEGVVIRGKSKRLLFDTVKLMEWLKTPVRP